MNSHEARQQLQHVKPSLRGLTDAEQAVLFAHRADRARERELPVYREYGMRAEQAAARVRAGQEAAHHIVVHQAAVQEVPVEVHHQNA